MTDAIADAPAGNNRDAIADDASAKGPIQQPVLYPQTDLFLPRSHQAFIAAVKHWNSVVSDVSSLRARREDIDKLIAAGNELAGRLMLRARSDGRG